MYEGKGIERDRAASSGIVRGGERQNGFFDAVPRLQMSDNMSRQQAALAAKLPAL